MVLSRKGKGGLPRLWFMELRIVKVPSFELQESSAAAVPIIQVSSNTESVSIIIGINVFAKLTKRCVKTLQKRGSRTR